MPGTRLSETSAAGSATVMQQAVEAFAAACMASNGTPMPDEEKACQPRVFSAPVLSVR